MNKTTMNKMLRYAGAGALALALVTATGAGQPEGAPSTAPTPEKTAVSPYLSDQVSGAIAYFDNWRPAEASFQP